MRHFLLCGGVNSRPKALEWLQHAVRQRRPDGILFAGGILDVSRENVTKPTTEWGLTLEDSFFIEEFLKTLGQLGVFCAVIHGRSAVPLEKFVRLGMGAEMDFPTLHIAHASLIQEDDVAVAGIGGLLTETGLFGLDFCSRTMAEFFLRPLWRAKQPRKILLLSDPPPGPLGGTEGNSLVGELIDSFHPSLCVVGGSSDRRGTQEIGSTLVVNPGYLADGWVAWLDPDRAAADRVTFENLRS